MVEPSPDIVLLGDPRPGQFEPIVETIHNAVGRAALGRAADVPELCEPTTGARLHPDMIVVLQAWPDEYSTADVNSLIAQFPRARIICCFGPWCDSDGRSRSIWPLAVRVPAASFASRFEHELALLRARAEARQVAPPAGSSARAPTADGPLPLTASRTEIFDFDYHRGPERSAAHGPAAVISPDRAWREMLDAALAARGIEILEETGMARATVVFFDVDPWNELSAARLTAIRQAQSATRLIACTGFSHPQFEASLRDAGADDVRSKLQPLAGVVREATAVRPLQVPG
ncbi:MAG: hypothetical protein HY290_06930 [Planctomycetia bacterium]|nr:hypothetical protein [Planctomycetia bacterium]